MRYAQDDKCALSGIALILESNSELDYIKPSIAGEDYFETYQILYRERRKLF